MFFGPQDILMLKHIQFLDNNVLDVHLDGRPVLVLDTDEDNFFFLPLTSHEPKNNKDHSQYIPIKKNKENGLIYPVSFINLRNVYKDEIKGYTPRGFISDPQFREILDLLKEYKENNKPDILYQEYLNRNCANSFNGNLSNNEEFKLIRKR